MYKLFKKTDDVKFNISKKTILYDSLYSDNSLEYIRYLIDNLDSSEVIILQFTITDISFVLKNKKTIKISLKLNRHSITTKVLNYLNENKNKFVILLNPPLEILKDLKLKSRKYIIYVNQLPADDLLSELHNPFLFIGRNFSNNDQSAYHNTKYYLYKNKVLSFLEKSFIYIVLLSFVLVAYILFSRGDIGMDFNSIKSIILENTEPFLNKFLGDIKEL